MADEQRKAATKRIRAEFTKRKSEMEYMDVRYPDIGAVLELIIDQEIRIENLEAAAGNGGNAPAIGKRT
jgi:hypothetical protein